MSPQHDYVIDNSTGANVRSDINSVLQAIASNNSGSSAPSTTFALQFYADTTNNILKLRNAANDGFINLFTLAGGIDVDAASNFNEDVTFTGASANIVFDKSDSCLEFADNAKAKFGAGDDLVIYHDGGDSLIQDAGTGLLGILTSGFRVNNAANNESIIKADENGAVELYHDNSKKFETTSSGCRLEDSVRLSLGTSDDFQLDHDGTDNRILNQNNKNFVIFSNADTALTIVGTTGDISLPGSSDRNLLWDKSDGCLKFSDNAVAKFGTGDDLLIYHDGSTNIIDGRFHPIELRHQSEVHIKCVDDGAVELFFNNSKKFETDTDGGKLTGFLHAHARVSESGFTTLDRHVIQTFNSNKECLVVESTASTPFGMRINYKNASPDNNSSYFLQCRDQSVDRLFIWSDGDIDNHDNSYGGMSDEKLKENIVDANSQWEDVKAIKVRNFNFKTDTPSDKRLGVVAQELETICPSLVREKSDFDENNNDLGTKTKSVKYSILYMKAFKALQEAITKIEVLEAKVAALEAA